MVLVCPPGSDSEAEARRRGLAVRARSMRNDWDLRAVRGLRRILARERPDLVHLHTGQPIEGCNTRFEAEIFR